MRTVSLLGPKAGGLVTPSGTGKTTALTFRNSPGCGLVMGIKDVYVVAGRDRGGNLINIE